MSDLESRSFSFPDQAARKQLAVRLFKESLSAMGWRYVFFVAAVIGFGLISLLPPQLFRYFTESTQTLNALTADRFLLHLVLFGGVVAAALLVASVANTLIHEWLRLKLEAHLRSQVLHRLHDIPLTVLDGAQRGDWLTRMTGDLGQVETFFTQELPNQIRNVAVLVGAGTLFFYHSGVVALVPLVTAVVLAFINLRVQRRLAPMLAELRQLHGGVFQALIENLDGMRTIRSHAVEPFVQRRFEKRLAEITQKSLHVVRYLGALMGGTELSGQLMVTACLTVVAYAFAHRQLTLEEVLVYPFFIGLFYGSAQSLASSAYDWNRYFIEGGRLGEILYDTRSIGPVLDSSARNSIIAESVSLSVSKMQVGQNERVAGPIQFKVNRGEIWGIVGPSGCGKSTFLEVLAGLRPALQGASSLSDGEGRVLWQLSSEKPLRLPIGPCAFLEQHPYIFEGTLKENLTFGNSDRLTDTILWEQLRSVGLELFTRRNGGLEYELKDRGRNLSVGERYRIALCRALLLKRPFLLLDEPFAALDEASVQSVITILEAEKEKSGVILVTHYVPEALSLDGILNFEDLSRGAFLSPEHELGRGQFPRREEAALKAVPPLEGLGTRKQTHQIIREVNHD